MDSIRSDVTGFHSISIMHHLLYYYYFLNLAQVGYNPEQSEKEGPEIKVGPDRSLEGKTRPSSP